MSPRLRIEVRDPQNVYFPGQTIYGALVIDLTEPTKVHNVKVKLLGIGTVSWSEGSGDSETRYSAAEPYISQELVLYEREDNQPSTHLGAGSHVFEFSFFLPFHLPMSYAVGNGLACNIRYTLEAKCHKGWGKLKDKVEFIVGSSGLDLNTVDNREVATETSDQFTLCCCCCASAPVVAKLKVNKSCFVPWENIYVDAEIMDGSGSGVDKTSIHLARRVTISNGDRAHIISFEAVQTIEKGSIPPGESRTFSGEVIRVPNDIPVSFSPGRTCRIIQVEYFIQLVVDVSGSFTNFCLDVPVIIGTIPLHSETHPSAVITSQPQFPTIPHTQYLPPSYDEVVKQQPTPVDVNLPFGSVGLPPEISRQHEHAGVHNQR